MDLGKGFGEGVLLRLLLKFDGLLIRFHEAVLRKLGPSMPKLDI